MPTAHVNAADELIQTAVAVRGVHRKRPANATHEPAWLRQVVWDQAGVAGLGSSSVKRLTGWAAMRVRTLRR
jgi:hypothetical protein